MQPTRRKNQAFMMIYAMFAMILLMGFTSLAVDWGRVETAKTELQNATDAAARYAVTGLLDNTYSARAIAAGGQNKVDGSALVLISADVIVGSWDSTAKTFTAGGASHDAVKVTGHRTAARGTAIPLVFAKAIGRSTCDINTTSIATLANLPYSVVALNGITMSGTSTISRTATETGSVIVGSNGTWSLGGASAILGDALYRTTAPTGNITGVKTAMSSDIAYSVVPMPGGVTPNPYSFTSGNTVVPGGTYYATTLSITGTATFQITGDVTVYCSGTFNFGGNCTINTSGTTYKFTVFMTNGSSINFSNNLPLNVVVYGPNSVMTVNSAGSITGSFVCKTLNMTQGTIQYSSYLPIPIAPTGGGSATAAGGISMVR